MEIIEKSSKVVYVIMTVFLFKFSLTTCHYDRHTPL